LLKLRDYKLKDRVKKKLKNKRKRLVRPEGFEPPTFGYAGTPKGSTLELYWRILGKEENSKK
jgi:hypothetical protein